MFKITDNGLYFELTFKAYLKCIGMKKLFVTLVLIAIGSFHAIAQEADIVKERNRIRQEEREMQQLAKDANQGQEIKAINNRYREQHQAIMQNQQMTQEQKREAIQKLKNERLQALHQLLGHEKWQEWQRLQEQQKTREQQKMMEKAKNQPSDAAKPGQPARPARSAKPGKPGGRG